MSMSLFSDTSGAPEPTEIPLMADSPVSTGGAAAVANPAVHPGQTYTVTIEKLTFGGSGLAHVGDLAVFVPSTIPGQQVEIIITKFRGNSAEGRVNKIVRKAKDEIMPKCQHFHDCGGCQWQNLPYEKQIGFKEEIVRETLAHLTPVDDAVRESLPGRVLKIIPSPQVLDRK